MRYLSVVTALASIVACSAFTCTPKVHHYKIHSIEADKTSSFTKPLVFTNNELNIRVRDSSLRSYYEPGDVSFVNVLFFLVIYSFGIFATIESSKALQKGKAEPSKNDIPVVEEVSNDEDDTIESVEDDVKDEPGQKDSKSSIKNPLKRIFKASEPTESVKEVELSSVKEEPVEEQSEEHESTEIPEPIPVNSPTSTEVVTQKDTSNDFNDIKRQVASTANQYPDITETLKKVASTKESVSEKYRLLALNTEAEERGETSSEEANTSTQPKEEEEESSTPKRKGFGNRVMRVAKKIIMPWKKFSEIQ